jgi:hypothetical protein
MRSLIAMGFLALLLAGAVAIFSGLSVHRCHASCAARQLLNSSM